MTRDIPAIPADADWERPLRIAEPSRYLDLDDPATVDRLAGKMWEVGAYPELADEANIRHAAAAIIAALRGTPDDHA